MDGRGRGRKCFIMASPEMLKRDQNFFLRYWIKGKCRIVIFPATQYTGAGVQLIICFYFRWANQMSTFFLDEQNQMSTFFQMNKPDEHLFSDEQTRWALFFLMSKPDEHYFSDEQGEMSTFLSDEQVRMSTLYLQMSTFYLWDEHLSTPWFQRLR